MIFFFIRSYVGGHRVYLMVEQMTDCLKIPDCYLSLALGTRAYLPSQKFQDVVFMIKRFRDN